MGNDRRHGGEARHKVRQHCDPLVRATGTAHGDREGGAPLVVFALLLIGVVMLDAVGRGVVAVVRRRILDRGLRRHS